LTKSRAKRILLINPPYHRLYKDSYSENFYPLGIGYLAGLIKSKTDWEVIVYNADFYPNSDLFFSFRYETGPGFKNYIHGLSDLSISVWKEVQQNLADYRPSIVGIYCCSASFVSASIVAKLAKSFNEQTVVILGGPHPSAVGKEVLQEQNIDIAVIGEAELTILGLLKTISNREPLDKVKGIAYRLGSEIVETSQGECITSLDALVFPHKYAPELLKDYDKYHKSAFRGVFVSRGCPFSCFFCGSRSALGRKLRLRSVANILQEIKSLQKFGLEWIQFMDDTFGVDREHTRQLCNSLIRECPGISWGCLTRVDLIDEQTLVMMKKAGCRHIEIGIESGNNEILKKIRKGFTIEEAFDAAKLVKKHRIKLTANFMVGFPEETEQTMNDTFAAMKKIKSRLNYSIFTPYPGTEAFEFCQQQGLIKKEHNVALYNHLSPENCFCLHLSKERFRKLALEIEKYADKHNSRQDLRNIFSKETRYKRRDNDTLKNIKNLSTAVKRLTQAISRSLD
jgi:anaerobic magnesium-protoporphyrin IX monomethyl ester cyclase